MLKSLRLTNFRSFKNFTIDFGQGSVLVGPNNAGKTTILTALRTADTLLRYAHARAATRVCFDGGKSAPAYPANLRDYPSLQESIRYEFRNLEARLELAWKSGAKLTVVWPPDAEDGDSDPLFYLERLSGIYVNAPAQARKYFPPLGVIPILTPVETTEMLLEEAYVRQNQSGRLSSRHFRNQLRILDREGISEDFLEWASPWLGGISIQSLDSHMEEKGMALDVYYKEPNSRIEKELAWAGDGIQIWMQLLYHVFRVRSRDTIVLDEPEVYLHPDLQRRLVQLLESTDRQVILATHSAELISEVDPRHIALVDKSQRRARRAKDNADLQMLSDMLGTAFNIRLAKALRSKVALFVEGQDMTVLRRFANTLELSSLAKEYNVTIIPLEGYTRWGLVAPFKWLCTELLTEALEICVILDRDYRPDSIIATVKEDFKAGGIHGHIWDRKELESYVLSAPVIARISGATEGEISIWMEEITSEMENEVFARLLSERTIAERDGKNHEVSIATAFKGEFDAKWTDADYRLRACPPKKVISGLNSRLQASKRKTVSAAGLARAHKPHEIPHELANLLRRVDELASS